MKKNRMLQHIKIILLSAVLLLSSFVMTSCTDKNRVYYYINNPERKNLSDYQQRLLNYIQASGIQVIQQGMKFTFIIPTDCFFVKSTGNLKSFRPKDLDVLGHFIHSYMQYFAVLHVTVTGYTDKVWLAPARDELSLHYAAIIAAYLEENGIDQQMMTVIGDSANHPIASNRYPMGTAFNRRVEVIVDSGDHGSDYGDRRPGYK